MLLKHLSVFAVVVFEWPFIAKLFDDFVHGYLLVGRSIKPQFYAFVHTVRRVDERSPEVDLDVT